MARLTSPLESESALPSLRVTTTRPRWQPPAPPRRTYVSPSKEQEAMSSAPGSPPNATPDTGSAWPGMTRTGCPCRTSHRITTSSKPPLACRGGRAGRGAGGAAMWGGAACVHPPSCSSAFEVHTHTHSGQRPVLQPPGSASASPPGCRRRSRRSTWRGGCAPAGCGSTRRWPRPTPGSGGEAWEAMTDQRCVVARQAACVRRAPCMACVEGLL